MGGGVRDLGPAPATSYRGCSAVELTQTRVLTGPDCFTGRSGDDISFAYDGGVQGSGSGGPRFRVHPRYDWQTRQAAFAVLPRAPGSRPDTLIGISATKATRCVDTNGVRVYTNVTAYRSQMIAWGRDVYAYPHDSGSVTARQLVTGFGYLSYCGIDDDNRLTGCLPYGGATEYAKTLFNFFTQAGDLNGDGRGEVLARTPGGALYRYPDGWGSGPSLDTAPKTWLSNGWNAYNTIFPSVDFSGDGYPDLLARDGSGNLWLHRGTGKGGYSARARIGTGWNRYNLITGRGDLSGDGLADLVARDGSGVLWLHRGTGKGGYAARTSMCTGFGGYKEIVASGDMDHDGRQDLLGRTPGGGVFLLNVNNRGGLLSAKLYAKTYWKPFTQIS